MPVLYVKTLTKAKTYTKLHCSECNWEQLIFAQTKNEIKCCPWCGWDEIESGEFSATGAFQEIECEKHGKITIAVTSEGIEPDDFMDNFFCPYCK